MPDTKGQSGSDNFERFADEMVNKSSSARFATRETFQGTGGDGPRAVETRGDPSDLALLVDYAPGEPPKKGKKK